MQGVSYLFEETFGRGVADLPSRKAAQNAALGATLTDAEPSDFAIVV